MQATTVGLDVAKTIFHVHGVTEAGEVAFNRPLRRSQVLSFFDRLAPVTSVNVMEIPGWPIEVIGQAACVDMLRSGSISAVSMSAKASTCM